MNTAAGFSSPSPKSMLSTLLAGAVAILLTACASPTVDSAPAATPGKETASAPATSLPTPTRLTGTIWGWQYTEHNGTRTTAVSNRYTLTFREENRLSVTADCNHGGSVYQLQGTSLNFSPVAMTKMLCPQGSQNSAFLKGLSGTTGYQFDGPSLVLLLKDGRMVFAPLPQ